MRPGDSWVGSCQQYTPITAAAECRCVWSGGQNSNHCFGNPITEDEPAVSPTPRTQPLIKRLLDLGIAASLLGVPAPAAYAQLVTTAPAWTGAFAGIAPGAKLGNASWTASQ